LKTLPSVRSSVFEGVVSGVLQPDGRLDSTRTAALVAAAAGMKFTFHRAFDWVLDPQNTLLELSKIGVHSLLTSGSASKAEEGLDQLKALKEMRTTVEIMPGSGLNVQNALVFKKAGF